MFQRKWEGFVMQCVQELVVLGRSPGDKGCVRGEAGFIPEATVKDLSMICQASFVVLLRNVETCFYG